MAKMSEINQSLKDINNWLKDHISYILAIIFVLVMAICVYGQADKDIVRAREEKNKINFIEIRLNEQMDYIHELKADLDNLYRVMEEK